MAIKIAPTDIGNTSRNIEPILQMRPKAVLIVAIELMAVMRKVLGTPKAVLIIAIELMAVMRKAVVVKMRMAGRKETIGTPSAIMQTHANTKYNTGIAKENCKR